MSNKSLPGPWHTGERALQNHEGIASRMQEVGTRVVRSFMPEQHRTFFEQLPFLVLGAVDGERKPWATMLEGPVGFLRSPDERTLIVAALPQEGDPTRGLLTPGTAIGTLGIELHTRRRNRANGSITEKTETGFALRVEQSMGNCPQYIHLRTFSQGAASGAGGALYARSLRAPTMTAALHLIERADTFFVASFAEEGRRQVDVSHRGGAPGFVRVAGDVLTIPDYQGNFFFNTLGNFLLEPHAGLLFVDFAKGSLVHLSGAVTLVLESEEVRSFEGAQRLWRLQVQQIVYRPGALALRFSNLLPEAGTVSPR